MSNQFTENVEKKCIHDWRKYSPPGTKRADDPSDKDVMGEAAQETLDAGFPIYYSKKYIPNDLLIKHYPDGRKELVKASRHGDIVVKVLK